ncbi:hypothetical protein D3C80_2034740 [compost metagenome]
MISVFVVCCVVSCFFLLPLRVGVLCEVPISDLEEKSVVFALSINGLTAVHMIFKT